MLSELRWRCHPQVWWFIKFTHCITLPSKGQLRECHLLCAVYTCIYDQREILITWYQRWKRRVTVKVVWIVPVPSFHVNIKSECCLSLGGPVVPPLKVTLDPPNHSKPTPNKHLKPFQTYPSPTFSFSKGTTRATRSPRV